MQLIEGINEAIAMAQVNVAVKQQYIKRLREGNLTRAENPTSHFCTYFLPWDEKQKKIFIVAHKKSGLWLSPGGHIEQGEKLLDALTREIREELGITDQLPNDLKPLLLTVTTIRRDPRACKEHFDIWYFIPSDGSNFTIDSDEFYETRWVSPGEARSLMTDANNLRALDFVEANLFARL